MNCVTTVDPIWLLEYGYKFWVADSHRNKIDSEAILNKQKFEKQLLKR